MGWPTTQRRTELSCSAGIRPATSGLSISTNCGAILASTYCRDLHQTRLPCPHMEYCQLPSSAQIYSMLGPLELRRFVSVGSVRSWVPMAPRGLSCATQIGMDTTILSYTSTRAISHSTQLRRSSSWSESFWMDPEYEARITFELWEHLEAS